MNSSIWNARRKPIVVGLLMNEADSSLLATACALAKKLESPLELVHAAQPIFSYMGADDVVINPYNGFNRVISELEEEESRKAMDNLKATLPNDLTVRGHVVRDYAPEALSTIATEVHAGLILCGIQKTVGQRLFGGMSTAFSLASHSDIPVLIIPLGSNVNFAAQPRMLVADNLETEGRHALEAGILLADELDCAEICHTHVQPLGILEVERMADKIKKAMNLGEIPANPEFSSKSYLEQIRNKIRDDLSYRFHNCQGAARIESRYEVYVGFGNPSEQLHKIASERSSQLIVFGRHHLFHRRGFALGKIPYNAMIEQGIATLIVPDNDLIQLTGPRRD